MKNRIEITPPGAEQTAQKKRKLANEPLAQNISPETDLLWSADLSDDFKNYAEISAQSLKIISKSIEPEDPFQTETDDFSMPYEDIFTTPNLSNPLSSPISSEMIPVETALDIDFQYGVSAPIPTAPHTLAQQPVLNSYPAYQPALHFNPLPMIPMNTKFVGFNQFANPASLPQNGSLQLRTPDNLKPTISINLEPKLASFINHLSKANAASRTCLSGEAENNIAYVKGVFKKCSPSNNIQEIYDTLIEVKNCIKIGGLEHFIAVLNAVHDKKDKYRILTLLITADDHLIDIVKHEVEAAELGKYFKIPCDPFFVNLIDKNSSLVEHIGSFKKRVERRLKTHKNPVQKESLKLSRLNKLNPTISINLEPELASFIEYLSKSNAASRYCKAGEAENNKDYLKRVFNKCSPSNDVQKIRNDLLQIKSCLKKGTFEHLMAVLNAVHTPENKYRILSLLITDDDQIINIVKHEVEAAPLGKYITMSCDQFFMNLVMKNISLLQHILIRRDINCLEKRLNTSQKIESLQTLYAPRMKQNRGLPRNGLHNQENTEDFAHLSLSNQQMAVPLNNLSPKKRTHDLAFPQPFISAASSNPVESTFYTHSATACTNLFSKEPLIEPEIEFSQRAEPLALQNNIQYDYLNVGDVSENASFNSNIDCEMSLEDQNALPDAPPLTPRYNGQSNHVRLSMFNNKPSITLFTQDEITEILNKSFP